MSLIQMVDGKQFVVKEKVAEVMELFGTSTPQGRGSSSPTPRRVGGSDLHPGHAWRRRPSTSTSTTSRS